MQIIAFLLAPLTRLLGVLHHTYRRAA